MALPGVLDVKIRHVSVPQWANIRPLGMGVRDGLALVVSGPEDLTTALSTLKKRFDRGGLRTELKKREGYTKPGERRRFKARKARAKARKREQREQREPPKPGTNERLPR
jgi:ribosomal protein S21